MDKDGGTRVLRVCPPPGVCVNSPHCSNASLACWHPTAVDTSHRLGASSAHPGPHLAARQTGLEALLTARIACEQAHLVFIITMQPAGIEKKEPHEQRDSHSYGLRQLGLWLATHI